MDSEKSPLIVELLTYVVAFFSSIIIASVILHLWAADLAVPFSYSGDVNSIGLWIKSVIDEGWYFHNSQVGMPFGLDMLDFPFNATFEFLIIKCVALFSSDYAVILNIVYLASFPLTTLTSVFVFRQLKISRTIAVFGGLLYTFIPYHFLRGEDHFLFSQYYLLPLVILVTIWIAGNEDLLGKGRNMPNWKIIISVFTCILIGLTTVYYTYFSCFFLLVGGCYTFFVYHQKRNFFTAISFIVIATVIMFLCLTPALIHQLEYGPNPTAWQRTPGDAEIYGLKIIQLLLPIHDHFIPTFAAASDNYQQYAPLVNENATSSLGLLGSIGFLLLLWGLLIGKLPFAGIFGTEIRSEFQSLFIKLSVLNISAVLLATIGGFGAIIAYVFPYIRGYNRISVFISFFSILAFMIYLQIISDKYGHRKHLTAIFLIVIVSLLIFGIQDMSNSHYVPAYDAIKAEYHSDDNFVRQIESHLPEGAMVFQLPYMQFLGGGLPNKIFYYDPLKPYLHSRFLRWSYGTMIDRSGDLWQREISQRPLDSLAESLSYSGFSGIWIDTFGYKNPEEVVARLKLILGTEPISSENGRYVFFDMRQYNKKLREHLTDQEFLKKQYLTLNPIIPRWGQGFSVFESDPDNNWRWASSSGTVFFDNPTPENRVILINTTIRTGWSENANVTIQSSEFSDTLAVNNLGTLYERKIIVPPGSYSVTFHCDAARVPVSDPRNLVFRMDNFKTLEIM
ncbi:MULTISPECIES: hypothetical protein [unclassified Methanoregula]|uniref:hypothetical protein n=1 Tax=unclassified Methanoregula TaxID=2649730 RepID=UPI0009D3F37F|nr:MULTISPECIES: hypothetical protein [unclassified Methanoregula]OPX65135.1 MAG: hypothetical protein A4E33_00166 [Methanoregula sp. PtaB.Bin085]OPY32047.1 MAG: hypothetical protein A4E34_02419 [Methanoregula sp. PtaU1.Bin006]